MKNLILILICLIPSYSFSSCLESNLYETDARLNSLPIDNQGDTNTCYAHSVAQLYNIQIATEQEEQVDPYWIAYVHKNKLLHWSPKNFDYSIASWAFKDLKKHGTCDFSILKEKFTRLKRGVPYNDDQLFYMLKHYFKVKFWVGVRSKKRFNYVINKLLAKLKRKSHDFDHPWKKEDLITILEPLRKETSRKRLFSYLGRYVFNECLQEKKSINANLISYAMKSESNSSLESTTAKYLSQGKPVYIGHCSDVVYKQDPAHSKNVKLKPRLLKSVSTRCGAHYSLLVGSRKTDQNKCQFLLRNSHGTGFWAHKSYTCYCEDALGNRKDCSKEDVEQNSELKVLGCWLDSDKLLANTYQMGTFK